MSTRKHGGKRKVTPKEKAEKKRSDAERTENLRQHFPAWTGKYRSGGRPKLKEIAIFMNLADEEEASKMLNHMRTFVFEPGTGYKRPFNEMALSDKNRAFVTLTSDENHPLDVHTLKKGFETVLRKGVTIKEIFTMKLFLEDDWPESAGEPDETTWKLIVNWVKCWFHSDLTRDTDHARKKRKEAEALFRMRHANPKKMELEQDFGDGARVKRKRPQAEGPRNHAKVNACGAEASPGASRKSQTRVIPAPAETVNLHDTRAFTAFAYRKSMMKNKHDGGIWPFVPLMFAKPGVSEPQNATDLDSEAIIKAVRERWRLVGPLIFDGQPEEQISKVIEETAGGERTINVEFDQSKAMRLD